MWTYNSTDEIYHHGILGQRWGIRRFQNKDGSLTKAGKKRAAQDEYKLMSDDELRRKVNRMNLEKRYYGLTDKTGNNSAYLDKTIKIGKDSSTTISNISKLSSEDTSNLDASSKGFDTASKTIAAAKAVKNAIKRKPADLSSMDDNALRDKVNRLDLERQYSSLKAENISRGKTTVMDILNVAGAVVALGVSATGLALNMYNMKKTAGN